MHVLSERCMASNVLLGAPAAGLEELVTIAECIGGHGLASVCRLLAEDHAGWSGATPAACNMWKCVRKVSIETALHQPKSGKACRETASTGVVAAGCLGSLTDSTMVVMTCPCVMLDAPMECLSTSCACPGGMPDLLLWSAEGRRAKLAEVKGPRDRLSEQQRAWAAALAAGGLQVEVRTLNPYFKPRATACPSSSAPGPPRWPPAGCRSRCAP